ncbi:MAG: hypothetical protein ACREFK_18930 [Stellaceae bacterium]
MLARRIGVDAAVLAIAARTQGEKGRAAFEIDGKLRRDRPVQLRPVQFGDEAGEGWRWRAQLDRKAAGPAWRGKRGGFRAAQKRLDNDVVERFAGERRCLQAVEIKDAQVSLRSRRIGGAKITGLHRCGGSEKCREQEEARRCQQPILMLPKRATRPSVRPR